jgi:hypothetical protein
VDSQRINCSRIIRLLIRYRAVRDLDLTLTKETTVSDRHWFQCGSESRSIVLMIINRTKLQLFIYFKIKNCNLLGLHIKNVQGQATGEALKVHKIENFFGSEFEFYTISLLVMLKY